jgi:hypothetical protein
VPVIATEHGLGTDDDERAAFIPQRLRVKSAIDDGAPVRHIHWSPLDNFDGLRPQAEAVSFR